jgi:hypothetical protein
MNLNVVRKCQSGMMNCIDPKKQNNNVYCLLVFLTFMKNIQFQFFKKQEVSFLIMGSQINGTLGLVLVWFFEKNQVLISIPTKLV